MIDKLDEIFPRRSPLESRALRGLLKVMRIFMSQEIRVKVFLRDDMLENILSSGEGFTALTHVTARQSDTLRWSEDQILTFVVKRLFSNEMLCQYCEIDKERLQASVNYQKECFKKVFPATVHRGVIRVQRFAGFIPTPKTDVGLLRRVMFLNLLRLQGRSN